jgi:hypothetical protein
MTTFMSVSAEAAVFAASFALLFLVTLTLRNPRQARWLDTEAAGQAVALIMTAALTIGFAFLTVGLVNSGLDFLRAFAGATVFGLAVSIFLWRIMRMNARLKACEEGRSPFHLSGHGGMPSGGGGAPIPA